MRNKDKKDKGGDTKSLYDKTLRSGIIKNFITGDGKRRIATAMVYERVGDSEMFIGGYPILKGTFPIGEYYVLEYKKPIFIDVPSSEIIKNISRKIEYQ